MSDNKKTAYVHQMYQHKGATQLWDALSWKTLIETLEAKAPKDRTFDGVVVEPIRRDGKLLLGLAKPLGTNYLGRLDSNGRVVDLMPKEDETSEERPALTYMQTAVALLLPIGDAVAIVHGGTQSPKIGSVLKVVEELHEVKSEYHWARRPLMDRGKIKQLKAGSGVDRFTTYLDTNRDIFSDDDSSLVGKIDGIGDALDANVQLEITISLPGSENTKSKRGTFLEQIVGSLGRLVPSASSGHGATANVYSQDGYVEELELVEHRMQVSFDVPSRDSDKARYTELVARLADAQDDISELVTKSL